MTPMAQPPYMPAEYAEGGEKAAGRELLSNVIQNVNLFISQPSQVGVFYARYVEPFPEAKAAWDSNIDKATNMQLTQAERNQAKAAIFKAIMKVSKDTLGQFEAEVSADPVYGGRVDTFFNVVNDVCRSNQGAAVWKLGLVSAAKYAVFGKI